MRNFGKIWENKYHIFILIFPAVGKKFRSGKKISRKVGKKSLCVDKWEKKIFGKIWEKSRKSGKFWEKMGIFFPKNFRFLTVQVQHDTQHFG